MFFCLHFVLVFLIQRRTLAFHPVTENNHVLAGHVFQQLYSRDWFSCIQACQDEPRCISYNYERSARANGLCELNDCGVKDLCDRDKSLIYSVGFVFQQIRKSKNENKCSLDKPVPTAPPQQNVTVVNKTSTSIFITWEAVPPNQRSGEILGYKVHYTKKAKGGSIRQRNVSTQTIYTNLTGLRKYKMYNITVMAYNQHGDGPPSKALLVRTDEDIPNGHPQNVTAINKTSTSILITWDEVPRGERKGHIDKYKVNYTSARNNVTKSKEVRAQSLEIVNLQANTNYTITVSASTVKGYGPASQPIVVATDQDRPSGAPQAVRAVNKTMNSIGVTWDEVPADQRNGDILNYTVSYYSDKSPNEEALKTVNENKKRESRFANLTHLTENTNYNITVLASNHEGNGPASAPIVVTTSDGKAFQCPSSEKSVRFFKDPNSCFHYYRCGYLNADPVLHEECHPTGTEFTTSSADGSSPDIQCSNPSGHHCSV